MLRRGAVVLCGGKSQRMGAAKACLPFGAELMLPRTVRLLAEAVPAERIAVVAAVDQELPPLPAQVRIVRDRQPDRGPLEGLGAGLAALGDEVDAVYASGCDAPLLAPAFVREMFAELGAADVAVPRDGEYFHPLAAVYRTTVLPTIEALLAADRLRTSHLFQEVATNAVAVAQLRAVDPDLATLRNLNHPEDYRAALAQCGFKSPEGHGFDGE